MMIVFEIKNIREKLTRQWRRYDFHQRWLMNTLELPLQFTLPRITDRQLMHGFDELQTQVVKLRKACEGLPGIELIDKEYNFASMGRQRIPVALAFQSLESLSKFIGQRANWDNFVSDVALLRCAFPQLEPWLCENITLIEQYHSDWLKLINICRYFINNPRPGLYLRQLDIIGIDSKFIETRKRVVRQLLDELLPQEHINLRYTQLINYGFEERYGLLHEKALVRFRILDPKLAQHFCGVRDITLSVDDFSGLELPIGSVYITENKINFLSLPDVENSIAIFGQGYGVQLLKQVTWLNSVKVFYWGDIDTNGFAILSQLRGYFPHVESLLMDEETIRACRSFWGDEPEKNSHRAELLPFLTENEQQVYQRLKSHYWANFLRIEQERIPFHLLLEALLH